MFKYTTVATNDDQFKLSANLNKDNKFYMPSLIIVDGDNAELFCDNETYLMETVYPYLKGDALNDEFDSYFSNNREDLLSVFEEAIKIGFFNEYYNKRN